MRLAQRRSEKLLSIRELAIKANVSEGTVHAIEKGMVTPSLRVIRKLIAALEISDAREIDEFSAAIDTHGQERAASGKIG